MVDIRQIPLEYFVAMCSSGLLLGKIFEEITVIDVWFSEQRLIALVI